VLQDSLYEESVDECAVVGGVEHVGLSMCISMLECARMCVCSFVVPYTQKV
jgi:hypothetical protein